MLGGNKRENWRDFIDLCQNVSSEHELSELLDFFFTIEEKQHIVTRVELVRELLQGNKTQRGIAQDLGISIAKITRGSNSLKTINEPLRKYLMTKLTK